MSAKSDAANAKLAAAIESATRRGESRIAAHMADALMRRLAKASGLSLDEYRKWLRNELEEATWPSHTIEAHLAERAKAKFSAWVRSRVSELTA
jgi:hypothetical protein